MPARTMNKPAFLVGVFLITFSLLLFQILQTRILSVIAWYYLAFFAISVAMLGMTVGAVWVYLRREHFDAGPLPATLVIFALLTAVAMPASIIVQFCLITTITLSLTVIVSWSLLLVAMAVPYVFSGVVVSLALTRSPFPIGQVYGADLLGARPDRRRGDDPTARRTASRRPRPHAHLVGGGAGRGRQHGGRSGRLHRQDGGVRRPARGDPRGA